jgi:hypothetical protein
MSTSQNTKDTKITSANASSKAGDKKTDSKSAGKDSKSSDKDSKSHSTKK